MCVFAFWVLCVCAYVCVRLTLVSSNLHVHLAVSSVCDEGLFPGVSDGD